MQTAVSVIAETAVRGIAVRVLMSVAIPVIIPVTIAFGPVAPFFVCLMLVVPVVLVSVLVVIPDEILAMIFPPEVIVVSAVVVEMQVRLGFVHHHFVGMVEIKIIVTWRQFMRKCPVPSVKINKLVGRHIIIGLYVRNIIIFHMIVSCWSPGRLFTDVDRKTDLCLRGVQPCGGR
jgi:hypothetical protein